MDLTLVVYATFAVLSARLLYHLYTELTAPDRILPGPWLSRVTRLWYLFQVRTGSFHHINIDLHKRYGPIVRVAPSTYSLSTPDKSVYGISSKFPKAEWYEGWKHPSPDKWTLFVLRDIKKHSEERKKFQNLYSMSSMLSYEGYVDHCVDIFVQKMSGFCDSGETIDLAHWLQCYAFDVIGEITYSERFGFLNAGEDVGGAISALDRAMAYSTQVGVFPKLHPYLYAIMEKFAGSGAAGRTYLMNFTRTKISERMESRKASSRKLSVENSEEAESGPRDFLDKLADANERDPSKVTSYNIFMALMSNIIAGSDTTAVSLSSIMFRLITHPDVLKKLREEVLNFQPANGRLTFKEAQEMPYLQAAIKESLRVHPATGLPLWRTVPEGGAEVAGQFFPAGTTVGINSWVAHYDTDVYGPDADVFRPERWQEAKSEDGERLQRMEANFMPFGLGSRTCIGRHISTLEMSKLIPEIVTKFDFSLGISPQQWRTVNWWFVKPERFPVQVSRIRETA